VQYDIKLPFSVILLLIRHVIKWDSLMSQAATGGIEVLSNPENLKILSNVLKTNVSAAKSIGQFFTPQLGRIYMDMLGLYRAVSGIISETVATQGTVETRVRPLHFLILATPGLIATKTPKVRSLRTIKKEVLKLVDVYVSNTEDLESANTNLMPALFEAILDDYNRNVAPARDAEVLNVMITIISRLEVLALCFVSEDRSVYYCSPSDSTYPSNPIHP